MAHNWSKSSNPPKTKLKSCFIQWTKIVIEKKVPFHYILDSLILIFLFRIQYKEYNPFLCNLDKVALWYIVHLDQTRTLVLVSDES